MQEVINLRIYTLVQNTDGIFNYKSIQNTITTDRSVNIVQGDIKNSLYLLRKINNSKIVYLCQNSLIDENEEIMFRIRKSFKKDEFEIINPIPLIMKKTPINIEYLNNKLWYVIKSRGDFFDNDNEEYSLNENDIIKLGRRKFEVIKFNVNSNAQVEPKNNSFNYNYNISELNKQKGSIFDINIKKTQYIIKNDIIKEEKEEEENEKSNNTSKSIENEKESIDIKNNISFEEEENIIKCRICFDSYSNEDNPLICLCSCKDYTHYECLKYYIKTKLEVRENLKSTVTTYNCYRFNCEVCLMPYPLRFRIPELNKIYEVVDLKMSSELDYMVLESLDYIKEKDNKKTIHIVKLVDEEYHIGRYESNDITDSDTSVSRNHAILKYDKEKGKLYLQNLSEKFGTLVLIKGNIKMKKNKQINFQVGRSYISARPEYKQKGAIDENKFIESDIIFI